MTPTFVLAKLHYGRIAIEVIPNKTLPIPPIFNMDDINGCARTIAAIMSNAAGGFTLRDVRCILNRDLGTVAVNAIGMSVIYKDRIVSDRAYQSLDILPTTARHQLLISFMERVDVINLGSVSTGRVGDDWKKPNWNK